MSSKKGAGRPIGSGVGKYTINLDKNREKSGRKKLNLTAEEIEERAVKQRGYMLACYYKKRALELERRKKNAERMEKIKSILTSIEKQLIEHEDLIDAMINDIHTSDEDNDDEELSNADIIRVVKRLRKSSPDKKAT